ncbi:universal stress protein [Aurantibacter crassamenti]|uniref:universal stress protein n=1 Tax=Aurantibacter crassamenti TaxID=1837375 RepID=UPI00193ADD50|nr:universal stress protein [Aurantibacter crassamenti]MBM1106585.1 universal stress protein [Aurantibacter crassamenti]
MTHNILVTTDFSYDSYNALFYVTQLYKNQKCIFHILYAFNHQSHFKQKYNGVNNTKELNKFLNNRAKECLLETYHKIVSDTEQNVLHKFKTISIHGTLEKAVKSYIGQHTIKLLVMGTKGRTGAMDIFFGGNTIQIVKSKIDCPVLCIPKQMDFRPISNFGFISSYKHSLEKYSLSIVKSLIAINHSHLHIIHMADGLNEAIDAAQEKNKELLSDYFTNLKVTFKTISSKKSKAKTIAEFAKNNSIDILAMCYYPHYFLDKLFREPIVLDLSIYSDIPLLILASQE